MNMRAALFLYLFVPMYVCAYVCVSGVRYDYDYMRPRALTFQRMQSKREREERERREGEREVKRRKPM